MTVCYSNRGVQLRKIIKLSLCALCVRIFVDEVKVNVVQVSLCLIPTEFI